MPITGIAHVNITVPPGTLEEAAVFYGSTLGFTRITVPVLQKDTLAWYLLPFPISPSPSLALPIPPNLMQRFDITPDGQQIHVSSASAEGSISNDPKASRHACFKLDSQEGLNELQRRIYGHFETGGDGKPMAADKPGEADSGMYPFLSQSGVDLGLRKAGTDLLSGAKGVEYPKRFFARDYAGNRLEFSL